METGKPSRTAWSAAVHRAAHQILEDGRFFTDPIALRIFGADAKTVVREAEAHPASRRIRVFIAVRQRFAEDALAAGVERDVRQLVVLGAGLDTYAYRSVYGDLVSIFEVDHPATQTWKRQRLVDAAIPWPSWLTFAPVDFERQTLAEGLATAGFDRTKQTFFTWLGVVPYLAEKTVSATLAFITSLPNGGHVVFDYSDPPHSLSAEARAAHDRRSTYVAALGEPWLCYFRPEQLHEKLKALGFSIIEDLGPRLIAARYFPNRALSVPDKGGHIVRASTV